MCTYEIVVITKTTSARTNTKGYITDGIAFETEKNPKQIDIITQAQTP